MQRSFGTEISANRRSNSDLLKETRSAIIAKRDKGALIQNLVEEFGCHRNTISKTINVLIAKKLTHHRQRNN
jgi:hypothetical protein